MTMTLLVCNCYDSNRLMIEIPSGKPTHKKPRIKELHAVLKEDIHSRLPGSSFGRTMQEEKKGTLFVSSNRLPG